MIDSIDIKNFRGFEHLHVNDCKRVNVIVGENGVGKTALLEAMFLALGASTELTLRHRQQRGLEGSFQGGYRHIERALWADFFHDLDMTRTISVLLRGSGEEARSLFIARGTGETNLPLEGKPEDASSLTQMTFTWIDASGKQHIARPEISKNGIRLTSTGEDLPDQFFYASSFVPPSTEAATRFSDLLAIGGEKEFLKTFTEQFEWIEDLSIGVLAGAPVILAKLKGKNIRLPVGALSGAINRMVSLFLAIATHPKTVMLVDEIEDGIHWTRHEGITNALLRFARKYQTQLFLSTHSKEWLNAFIKGVGDDSSDVQLLRLERTSNGPELFQIPGDKMRTSAEYGAELRGHSSPQ
jgi:energy-coupling factor transporter ATP-binding protein EcfA2